MNTRNLKLAAVALALLCLGIVAGYGIALRKQPAHSAAPQAAQERKPLYWYDPMVPAQHFDKPGKSPFMDMELVPMYAEDGSVGSGVRIDAAVLQNLGIRLAKVEQSRISNLLDAVATVQFNDRDVAAVQARSGGFVEHVHGHAPGDVVARGAPLVELRVPEWSGAQQEYLALRNSGGRELIDAGRERLRNLGMSAEQIARLEQSGQARPMATIVSPIAGVIESLDARIGMNIVAGAPLARINGVGTVWLEAAVAEADSALVWTGMSAQAKFAGYPGETFAGKVIAVLPDTNRETHTLRVRVELANPRGQFRPGMFAQLRLTGRQRETALLIPSEAVIRSGTRSIVITVLEGNRFQPVEVIAGRDVDGRTVILKGLSAGQQVVASGQFLIDSEASLKGVVARMEGDDTANKAGAAMQSGRLNETAP